MIYKNLLFALSFFSFAANANTLICDGGIQKIAGEDSPMERIRGDDFEIKFHENYGITWLKGLAWCSESSKNDGGINDEEIFLSCSENKIGDTTGDLRISRLSGSYDYKFNVISDGVILLWLEQNGKCSIAKEKLF